MKSAAEQLAVSIVEKLQAAGHVAYLAGGCVRDRLMGALPKDFDVATSARPEEVVRLFPRSQQVGAAFGVILVRGKKEPGAAGPPPQVEVATFRSDGVYSDGRHPDSVRFTTAQEDAQRRDFTCNGLFLDPLAEEGRGRIHDFVGGQRDIDQKVLRAIGTPEARFAEDHLRMLRAVRFAARLGFAIDERTFEAIRAQAGKIRGISKERIHDELDRILSHPTRATAAELLQRTGLLRCLWPEELLAQPDLPRQWPAITRLPPEADFIVALIALQKDLLHEPPVSAGGAAPGGMVAESFRRELLLNNVETADLAWLTDHGHEFSNWRQQSKARLKRMLADPRCERLFQLYLAAAPPAQEVASFRQHIAALRAEGVAPAPFITGETLIQMGAKPGPAFKGWLESLYDRQLENHFAGKDEAIDAARRLIHGG